MSTLASAIYVGRVRHRRHTPRAHAFEYQLFMPYLDLGELDRVFARRWFWSVGRPNLAQFRRADFHGDPSLPLDTAVRETVTRALGRHPEGPIRLLAHLRYFGHCFNPVSFYFGFAPDGERLEWILAEITNTPWKERHAYVLPVRDAKSAMHEFSFDKAFHVSPFVGMARRYHWRLETPGERLRIHMDVDDGAQREFDATLSLERRPATGAVLARALLRHPFMTARVVLAIHWQALRLWLKRVPVHDHPALAAKATPSKGRP